MDELEMLKREKVRKLMEKIQYPDKPLEANEGNINELINKYPILVVDFWAVWCPPCRIMSPIIDSLAKRYRGKVVFAKLNVDENKRVAVRFKIMSIPTLLVFKDKKLVDRIVGARSLEQIEERLKRLLE